MGLASQVVNTIGKNAPTILIGAGVTGMVSSVIFAIEATPKALQLLEEKEAETPVEVVKATWTCYIPTALMMGLSIFCFVKANSINLKRNAALATICAITENSLKEYQSKVIEKFGEKKELEVRDELAEDALKRVPVGNAEVIFTGRGNTLCFDATSGRYFRSDIESIRRVENELNKMVIDDVFVSLNDMYAAIGLCETLIGDYLGWNADHLIEFDFSSQIAENGEPCIVIKYITMPTPNYRRMY